MKILITNGHLKVGGVEKSLVDLLKRIDYSRYQVDLLLFEGYGEYLEQIPKPVNVILWDFTVLYGSLAEVLKKNIKCFNIQNIILKIILTLGTKCSKKFFSLFKYFKVCSKHYDYAIAYRIGMPADFVAFSISAIKKYVWWHHGEFEYDNATVQAWKKTFKNIDNIICVSEATKKMLLPHFPEKADSMSVIPNMILRREIVEKSCLFNPYSESNLSGQRILVSIGRMSPEKMMINAVHAMSMLLHEGYNDIVWYLIGDGVEMPKIAEAIKVEHLEEKIILTGNLENPYPYLKDAFLYVHPSYVESQGLTILEAMALEVPCVVTKSRGPCEFIHNGVNGILVEQGPNDLAEGIIKVINDESLYRKIKRNTMCPVQFEPEQVIKKVENLFV